MISNITQTPLPTYSRLPKSWPARPNLVNYDKSDAAIHQEDGWREVIRPTIQSNQKLGELYYDAQNDIVTYAVLDKTPEELEAESRAMVPYSITPGQGKIMLRRIGKRELVEQIVAQSSDGELQDWYEYALSWERDNPYITSMANLLGMSEQDLDEFFVGASGIN